MDVYDILMQSMSGRAWEDHLRYRAAILSVLRRRLWWFRFVRQTKQNEIADDLMGAIDTGI